MENGMFSSCCGLILCDLLQMNLGLVLPHLDVPEAQGPQPLELVG